MSLPNSSIEHAEQKHVQVDVEKNPGTGYAHLSNTSIHSFGWKGVSVQVKDRQTKQQKHILSDVDGFVKAGEMLALMGPRSVSLSYSFPHHNNLLTNKKTVVQAKQPSSTS